MEFDRVISAEPCLHTSVERVTMSTHIGRTCDYVYTHRSRVYRPGRSKESLSSVRTVPIGDDRSKCLRGTHGLSSRSITTTGHHVMRSHCVRTCDRIASRKMENGSRQWKSAMVTGHHGNEQQRSPPDEASGRSSSNAVLRIRASMVQSPWERAATQSSG